MSLLPAFLDALVSAATAASATGQPLDGVLVTDGFVISEEAAENLLFVGATDTPGEPGASTVDGSNGDLPQFVVAEQLIVESVLICWAGDTGVTSALRVRAYGFLAAIEQLLVPTSQGVTLGLPELAWARIAGTSYVTRQEKSGLAGTLSLTISAQAEAATR